MLTNQFQLYLQKLPLIKKRKNTKKLQTNLLILSKHPNKKKMRKQANFDNSTHRNLISNELSIPLSFSFSLTKQRPL